MKGYHDDIERQTTGNDDFRRVLYTGHHLQLVLMTIQPGEEIGAEVHEDRDQFFRFEQGSGMVDIDDNTYDVGDGSGVARTFEGVHGDKHGVSQMGNDRSLEAHRGRAPSI